MLLIRPWIRMNQCRVTAHHIVFFIFIVANVGGCLTPIGDPPLFLGYLQGIPFWWVAENCWPMWAAGRRPVAGDFLRRGQNQFPPRAARMCAKAETATGTWRFDGLHNLFFLAVILGAVFVEQPPFLREALMIAAAAGSYFTTKKSVHAANQFDFHPILEVAILFAGIFATMMPALDWLDQNAARCSAQHPAPGDFLLGHRRAVQRAGQRADLSWFFERAVWRDRHERHPCIAGQQASAKFWPSASAQCFSARPPTSATARTSWSRPSPNSRTVSHANFLDFIFKFSLPFLLPVLIIVWFFFFGVEIPVTILKYFCARSSSLGN